MIPFVVFSQNETPLSDQPSLTQRSPFLPPGFNPETKTPEKPRQTRSQANKALEFRGVYQLLGDYRFLVKESSAAFGNWVKLNDPKAVFVVTQYDPSSQTVTVEHEGVTHEISLIELEGNPAPIPVNGQPPAATHQGNTAANQGQQVRPQIPVRNNTQRVSPGSNRNSNPSTAESRPVRRPPPAPPRFSNGSTPQSNSSPIDASGNSRPPPSGPPQNVVIPEKPDFIPTGPPPGPPPELPEALRNPQY